MPRYYAKNCYTNILLCNTCPQLSRNAWMIMAVGYFHCAMRITRSLNVHLRTHKQNRSEAAITLTWHKRGLVRQRRYCQREDEQTLYGGSDDHDDCHVAHTALEKQTCCERQVIFLLTILFFYNFCLPYMLHFFEDGQMFVNFQIYWKMLWQFECSRHLLSSLNIQYF